MKDSIKNLLASLSLQLFVAVVFLVSGTNSLASDVWGDNGSTPVGSGSNSPSSNPTQASYPNANKTGNGTVAEPVDLFTGQFELNATDIHVPGRMPLQVIRYYRSGSTYQGMFGRGWNMDLNERILVLATNGNLLLRRNNTSLDQFSNNGNGTYSPPLGCYDTITQQTDGSYVLREKHGTLHIYNNAGCLTEVRDRNYNQLLLTYQAGGKLPINAVSDYSHFTNPILVARDYQLDRIDVAFSNVLSGRFLQFQYDGNGRATNVTDFTGRAWTYTYDAGGYGDLVAVTTPAVTGFPNGLTTQYSYSATNAQRLITITDPTGQTYLTNSYDSTGHVVKQIWGTATYSFAYPAATDIWVTNGNGYKIERTFDTNGNVLSLKQYTAGLRPTDPASYLTQYAYNTNNEQTNLVYAAGNAEVRQYDSFGNLLQVRRKMLNAATNSPSDIVTSMSYESTFNFVTNTIDPRTNATTLIFDYAIPSFGSANGNLAQIIYPAVGGTNPSVSFAYNVFGQEIASTNPVGTVTQFVYDNSTGYLLQRIDAYGTAIAATNTYSYDSRGNILSAIDPLGNTTGYQYDSLDRLTKVTSAAPFSFVTTYSYNADGKLTQIQRQTGDATHPLQTTTYGYDILDRLAASTNDLNQVTRYVYDGNGNRILITDANGNSTAYAFDERNLSFKVTDAISNVVQYSYNTNGHLAQILDARSNATVYAYDSFDRLTSTTYPDSSVQVFAYDPANNTVAKGLRANTWITNVYDNLNRLILKTYSDSSAVQYTYDAASRLISTTNSVGTSTFARDALGRLTTTTNEYGNTVSFVFDANGNRSKLTYSDGSFVTYAYDTLNRLTNIMDAAANPIAGFAYDALGRRQQLHYGNGTRASYAYDWANNVTNITHVVTNTAAVLESFSYTYDNVGNRLTMTTLATEYPGTHAYSYDKTYQLTNVNYPFGYPESSTGFSYDAARNRSKAVAVATTNYTANILNEYTSVGGQAYLYNANGDLGSDGTTLYNYDDENHLTFATNSNITVTYSYDSFGQRLARNINGTITRFVYAGGNLIAEYDGAGNLLKRYVHGLRLDSPLLMLDGSTRYYYHAVASRTVVALTSASAVKVDEYSYGAYGELLSGNPTTGNRFLFTGRELDLETGLYFLRHRHYSAGLGRFLQPDPIDYWGGINLYGYCANNPINYTDPLGLCSDNPLESWKEAVEAADYFRYGWEVAEKFTDVEDSFNAYADSLVEGASVTAEEAALTTATGALATEVSTIVPMVSLGVLSDWIIQTSQDLLNNAVATERLVDQAGAQQQQIYASQRAAETEARETYYWNQGIQGVIQTMLKDNVNFKSVWVTTDSTGRESLHVKY